MNDGRKRELGAGAFCAIVLIVGLVLFALPYPAPGQARRVAMTFRNHAKVAVVGPSTLYFVSDCDRDKRTLATMIGDAAGGPVLDLSAGGQETADSLNLAATAGHSASVTDVILPIVLTQTDDWTTPPYRSLLFYKALNPGFETFGASTPEDFWHGVKGDQRRLGDAYDFEGKHYGTYNQLAATVFAKEKQLSSCPESETHDRAFTRSYFWWTYVAKRENPAFYPLVADLQHELAAKGKRLHVVMLPANLELIDKLQPGWGAQVAAKHAAVVRGVRAAGVPVLDLTKGFGADEFGTPWCACSHLNEKGRKHLTAQIVGALKSGAPPARQAARPPVAIASKDQATHGL